MIIKPKSSLKGYIPIPGDKSISHRAIILASIAEGKSSISNFLLSDDCLATINCFKEMGINIKKNGKEIIVDGKGLNGLKAPKDTLDVGNSGTTIRLLSGLLAGQNFDSIISGDSSIRQRPMDRIITPLMQMNARISSKNKSLAPLKIQSSTLKAINYNSPIASAQVKSSILLAGLYAEGETIVNEPILSRNHTELMLDGFGANVTTKGTKSSVTGYSRLRGLNINIPGDISSAAFFIVAGLIVPNSEIYMENIGINPTRAGLIKVLIDMGGDITLHNKKVECGEMVADILVKSSNLIGTKISGNIIPSLIDEIPIITVAACFAQGKTIISDAQELKVKECDRILAMTSELNKMGANIQAKDDGMVIRPVEQLKGTHVESYYDHRVAMSLAIAGLASKGDTIIHNSSCISISFPQFQQIINSI